MQKYQHLRPPTQSAHIPVKWADCQWCELHLEGLIDLTVAQNTQKTWIRINATVHRAATGDKPLKTFREAAAGVTGMKRCSSAEKSQLS